MELRAGEQRDRERIREILLSTALFTPEEIGWALELVDLSFAGRRDEFRIQVAETPLGPLPTVTGYVCYGPTPRTQGVWDLYWIAVDRAHQRKGAGNALIEFVEREVRSAGGRLLLIETSSAGEYRETMRFYERHGYAEISRIKDFYRVRHDKIVLGKEL